MPETIAMGALLALCAAGALLRGGRIERIGAALFVAAWAVAWLAGPWALAQMGLDAVLLVALGRLAWRAPRTWPVWALACQAVAVAASLAYALQPDIGEETWLRGLALVRGAAALALAVSLWRPRPPVHA